MRVSTLILAVVVFACLTALVAEAKKDDAASRLADRLKAEAAEKAKAASTGGDKKAASSGSGSGSGVSDAKKKRSKSSQRAARKRTKAAERVAKSLAAARRQNKAWARARADRKKRAEALSLRRYKRAAKLSEKLRTATQKANRAKANAKLAWMSRATAASNTGILSVSTDQYKEYVMSGPRPYWLFLSYTALQSNYRCQYCAQMHEQFTILAPAYHNQHNFKLAKDIESGAAGGLNPSFVGAEGEGDDASGDDLPAGGSGDFGLPGAGTSRLLAGVTGVSNNTREPGFFNGWWWVGQADEAAGGGNSAARETFKSYPVFFVEIDISRNQELFNALNLKTAPVGVLLPPKLISSFSSGGVPVAISNSKMASWFNGIDKKYHFAQVSGDVSANDVLNHVSKWTTIRVDITPPVAWLSLVWMILLGASVLAGAYFYWERISKIRGLSLLLCMFGLIAYSFCVGGGMYNVLRDIPFSETQKDGSVNYIYYTARDQLGAEGYIMGFLQSACGICTVLLIRNARAGAAPTAGASAAKKKGGSTSASALVPPAALRSSPLMFLFDLPVSTYFAVLVMCWYVLVHIYTLKNGGYRHGWLFAGFADWM